MWKRVAVSPSAAIGNPSNIPLYHNLLPLNLFSWASCSNIKVTHDNMICTFAVLMESRRLDYCTHCHCHNKLAYLCEEPGLRSVTCCNINRCNLPFNSINLSVSFVEITSVITKYRLALWGWNISKIEHHPNNPPCGFYPNILVLCSEEVAPARSSLFYSSNVCFQGPWRCLAWLQAPVSWNNW